jgi:hypothetical protein
VERDLCVGGVEISNPCRTFAYVRNLGNKCWTGGGNAPCCDCDGFSTDVCTPAPELFTASVGAWAADPTEEMPDRGTQLVTLAGDVVLVNEAAMTLGVYEVGDGGPCVLPSLPATSDPDWTVVGGAPGATVEVVTNAGPGNIVACVLRRFDVELDGDLIGHLFVVGDPGLEGDGVSLRWKPLTGTATSWADVTSGPLPYALTGAVVACEDEPEGPPVYTTPAEDDAPWYDPEDLRSADVLGVWLNSLVVSSPHKQSATPAQWGSSFGSVNYEGRELAIAGRVYVRNRAAAEYARHWLYEALVNSPCSPGCLYPDAEIMTYCNGESPADGLRILPEVALTDWQWDTAPDVDHDCWVEFTAVLTSKKPWMVKLPTPVHSGLLLTSAPFCDICGNMTSAGECPPTANLNPVVLQCGCADQPARIISSSAAQCYVRPMYVARQYVTVPMAKLWTDGVLRLTVFGGTEGLADSSTPSLKNLRVRAWANPDDLGPEDGDTLLCGFDPCADVQIGCVPYGATLVVDGSSRRAYVTLDGQSRSARPYLSSEEGKFTFPEYSCSGLMLAIDVDAVQTAPDCSIFVETIEVERG